MFLYDAWNWAYKIWTNANNDCSCAEFFIYIFFPTVCYMFIYFTHTYVLILIRRWQTRLSWIEMWSLAQMSLILIITHPIAVISIIRSEHTWECENNETPFQSIILSINILGWLRLYFGNNYNFSLYHLIIHLI